MARARSGIHIARDEMRRFLERPRRRDGPARQLARAYVLLTGDPMAACRQPMWEAVVKARRAAAPKRQARALGSCADDGVRACGWRHVGSDGSARPRLRLAGLVSTRQRWAYLACLRSPPGALPFGSFRSCLASYMRLTFLLAWQRFGAACVTSHVNGSSWRCRRVRRALFDRLGSVW